jgi:hypothetical protein
MTHVLLRACALAAISTISGWAFGADAASVMFQSGGRPAIRCDAPVRDEPSDNDLLWKPPWREKGDCGPLALFVLLKLQEVPASVYTVKKLTPVDPQRGCSFVDLKETAERMGLQTEIRFVTPKRLSDLFRPFILHGVTSIEKNYGHYVVVVAHDGERKMYGAMDPVRERFGWYPEASLHYGYSGYVLVPLNPASVKAYRVCGQCLFVAGTVFLSVCLWNTFVNKRRAAGPSGSARVLPTANPLP